MKKMFVLVIMFLSVTHLWSQVKTTKENRNFRVPLIGESAPSFTAESTKGTLNFPGDYGANWKILFSHPQDFTPVCTTEILELAHMQEEFNKLGVDLVVVSSDPIDTHFQWKKSMETLNLNNRGLVKIDFPLVDDEKLTVSKQYGMIHAGTNSTNAVRGVFIIDPGNIIQAIYFYPQSVGRNTDELIRLVEALQTTASDKVMTPVNWRAGNDLLMQYPKPTDGGAPAVSEGYYSPVWYMLYRKANQK